MKREQIWLRLTLGCDPTLGCGCFLWFVATILLSPLLSFGDFVSLRVVLIYLGCSAACWYYALAVTRCRAEVAAVLLVPRLSRYAIQGLLLFAAAQIALPSLIIGLSRRSLIEGLVSCAIQVIIVMAGLIALRMNPNNVGRSRGNGWLFFYLAIILLGLEKAMWGASVPHYFGWAVTALTACLTAFAAWLYWPVLMTLRRSLSAAPEREVNIFFRVAGEVFLGNNRFDRRDNIVCSDSQNVFEGKNFKIDPISGTEALRSFLWKELKIGFEWRLVASEFLQRLVVLGLVGGVIVGFPYLLGSGLKQPPNLMWFFLVMLNSTTLEQAKKIWSFNQHMSADRELAALVPGFGEGYTLKSRFLRAAISPSIQNLVLDIIILNIGIFSISLIYRDHVRYDSIFSIVIVNSTMIIYNSVRMRALLKALLGKSDPNKHGEVYLMFVSMPFVLLMIIALEMPNSFMAILAGICAFIVMYIVKLIRDDLRVYFSYPHPFLPKH